MLAVCHAVTRQIWCWTRPDPVLRLCKLPRWYVCCVCSFVHVLWSQANTQPLANLTQIALVCQFSLPCCPLMWCCCQGACPVPANYNQTQFKCSTLISNTCAYGMSISFISFLIRCRQLLCPWHWCAPQVQCRPIRRDTHRNERQLHWPLPSRSTSCVLVF